MEPLTVPEMGSRRSRWRQRWFPSMAMRENLFQASRLASWGFADGLPCSLACRCLSPNLCLHFHSVFSVCPFVSQYLPSLRPQSSYWFRAHPILTWSSAKIPFPNKVTGCWGSDLNVWILLRPNSAPMNSNWFSLFSFIMKLHLRNGWPVWCCGF